MMQEHPPRSSGPLPYSSLVDLPLLADLNEKRDGLAIRSKVDLGVNTIFLHLRRKMKKARVSQLAVLRITGWKDSYLSQLFNRTKAPRVEQPLIVLGILDRSPHHFFYETCSPGKPLPHIQPGVQKSLLQWTRQGFSSLGEVLKLLFLKEKLDESANSQKIGERGRLR